MVFRASGFTLCGIGVILNLGGDRRFQVTKVLQDPRKVCTVDCRGAAPATQGTDRHMVKEGQLASICGGLGYVWVEGGQ